MNIIVDNLDTKVEVSGGGLSILMLHGWKDSLDTFDTLTSDLEQDFKVIRIDLPGFGGTQAPNEPWTTSRYADFVAKTLLKLEENEIYAVIAHSMGARIAINMLARRAIEAEKLILIAGAGIPASDSRKNTLNALAKGGKALSSILPASGQEKLRQQFYKMSGSDYLGAGELTETFKLLVNEDSREYAKDIRIPTLLIYSDNDKLTPLSFGEQYQELIPSARLENVGSLGHNIHKNDPEKVVGLIRDFL